MKGKVRASDALSRTASLGRIEVSPRVVASIVGHAANECYGIVGMAARGLRDGIAERLNRENVHRGVEIQVTPDGLVIELYVIAEYGTRISEVAHNLMSAVSYSVEKTLGLRWSRSTSTSRAFTRRPTVSATKPAELSVLREPLREIGGEQVLAGLTAALSWLEANQQEINDLNVFPVPDGDTGSNMYLTLRSAVEEARDAPTPEAADSVLAAAAHGSLMGARGNSGVILSQILRGFAQGVAQRSRIDAGGLGRAMSEASAVAYRAVMKPTEGTILTVVRDAASAAAAASAETDDIRVVLDRVVSEAHAAVERTIDQLQVLRDANVVDAGGFGLAVILEGFARAVGDTQTAAPIPALLRRSGEPQLRLPPRPGDMEAAGSAVDRRGAAAVAPREQGWGYCTEFLINGPGLDVEAIRGRKLSALGGSGAALVVGDPGAGARAHPHRGSCRRHRGSVVSRTHEQAQG